MVTDRDRASKKLKKKNGMKSKKSDNQRFVFGVSDGEPHAMTMSEAFSLEPNVSLIFTRTRLAKYYEYASPVRQ